MIILCLFALLTSIIGSAYGDVDIITKQCREDWCYALHHDDPRFQGEEYYDKLINLFSSGFAQLVYADIDNIHKMKDVSMSCKSSLSHVQTSMMSGMDWAFTFVDSSAKLGPAFLEGSVTSFGDYDQCLGIQDPANKYLSGKYCLVDIFPEGYVGKERRRDGRVSLNQMQHFNDSAYYISICLPSPCSVSDVRNILSQVLKPFPLRVHGYLHCDTQEENSLSHRLRHMPFAAIVSLSVISSVVCLVMYGTYNHVFRPETQSLLSFKSFSLVANFYNLVIVDPNTRPDNYASLASTGMKMFIIFCGVAAHVYACFELMIGFFVMSHHKNMEKMMSDPGNMPLFGDAGIVISTALAGYANFMITYPLAKSFRLSIKSSIMDKCLRFVPVIICVMCLDMIWYLPFSGPLVGRVGPVVTEKCSKYWWRSVLFISNLIGDSLDICSGHTYSLSVDVQLFTIGLLVVLVYARKPALGIMACLVLTACGLGLGFYYARVYDLTPNLLVGRNPSVMELERFLQFIHMATSSYVPSYFLSMLLSYLVYEGHLNRFADPVNHWFWCTAILVTSHAAQYAPMLSNILFLPKTYVPYFIVGTRTIVAVETLCMLAYAALMDINQKLTHKPDKRQNTTDLEISPKTKKRFSAWKMLVKLSFAIYMCNYLFIRTDFFTTRHVFYNDLYVYFKRAIVTLIILIPWSIFYHLFFVAPFMSLAAELKSRRSRISNDGKHESCIKSRSESDTKKMAGA